MIKYLIIFLPIFIVILLGGLFLTIKKLKPDYEILKIEILNPVTQLVKLRGEVEIADTILKNQGSFRTGKSGGKSRNAFSFREAEQIQFLDGRNEFSIRYYLDKWK